MRHLDESSAMWKRLDRCHTQAGLRCSLIFAIGAGFGSILTALIGLEYTSWLVIVLCWPLALVFAMLERMKSHSHKGSTAAWPWRAPATDTGSPPPRRPPLNPRSGGLHRIK